MAVVPPRALVVDDFGPIRRSCASALRDSGYSAFEAWDLDAAREIARLAVPDVLVIDERVIESDRFAFGRLRSDPRFREVLVVALASGLPGRGALVGNGVHAIVDKLAHDDVVAAVRWVLDVYREDPRRDVG
jgi:DNA-binding response OmpR family regulator